MCIVIDANIVPVVFSRNNSRHEDYKSVLLWFIKGRAKLVLGGYFWRKEIGTSLRSYLPLMQELSRLNKTHMISDTEVDVLSTSLKAIEPDEDFDDPHIVALLSISGARILCSEDARSFRFVKDRRFYRNGRIPPKILDLSKHESCLDLLGDDVICDRGEHLALPPSVARQFLLRFQLE